MTNVSPTDPATLNRHLGEAAVRLAAINPAEAERLVPGVVPNFWDDSRAEYVLRICRRMARVDLPRARKILDTIDKPTGRRRFQAALCPMDSVSWPPSWRRPTRPGAGTAGRGIRPTPQGRGRAGGKETDPPVSCVMAALLPLVERLEPDRLEERLWLTAACRASLAEQPDMNAVQARRDPGDAGLALRPRDGRRHHRTRPRTPAGAARRCHPAISHDNRAPIKALAAYDPRAVVALIRQLARLGAAAPAEDGTLEHSGESRRPEG